MMVEFKVMKTPECCNKFMELKTVIRSKIDTAYFQCNKCGEVKEIYFDWGARSR